MNKKIIGVIAFAFSLAFGQAVFADPEHCGEGLKTMIESLKLDSAQKEKIKPILEQLKSTVKDTAIQMKDVSVQLNQQADSPNMDQSTVDGLIDKKTKLIGDVIKAKMAAKNQIMSILTPEQKAKLHDMMKKMEEKIESHYKDCHDDD